MKKDEVTKKEFNETSFEEGYATARRIYEPVVAQTLAEYRERMVWVKYKDKKPVIGQLVIFYRDIESRQIIATKWTKEEENYAEMNEITHWVPIEYPDLLSSLDKLTDKLTKK